MHMSGCSASCAQPQIADIGFRGETVQLDEREARSASERSSGEGTEPRDPEGTTNEEGDNIVEGMDFGLGGSLGSDNEFIDWVETAVPAQAVVPALEELCAVYTEEREAGERFYQWTRQVGNDRLRSIMQRADEPVSQGVAHGD
jgi:ferredoxin-nitrite reductase